MNAPEAKGWKPIASWLKAMMAIFVDRGVILVAIIGSQLLALDKTLIFMKKKIFRLDKFEVL
ncbi:hypothetical protein MASR2M78_22060 [Treponema sp.]